MKTITRLATLADLPEYTKLLQLTYQSTYVDVTIGLTTECFSEKVFSTQNTQDYLKSHLINSPIQKTWLAFNENDLIAAITCILNSNNEAEITGFYVHPKHQGKGIGKELYSCALFFAGNRDLILDIYFHNKKSVEVYKKWGWVLDESRGDNGFFMRHWPEWPKGLEVKCIYMRLKNIHSNSNFSQ